MSEWRRFHSLTLVATRKMERLEANWHRDGLIKYPGNLYGSAGQRRAGADAYGTSATRFLAAKNSQAVHTAACRAKASATQSKSLRAQLLFTVVLLQKPGVGSKEFNLAFEFECAGGITHHHRETE